MAIIGLPLLEATGALSLYPATRLLADLKRLGAQLEPRARPQRRFLFVSLKPSWIGNMAYESTLALALAQRGVECSFLFQGKALPICDQSWYRHTVPTRAWASETWARAFSLHLPFPVYRLDRFLENDEPQAFTQQAEQWDTRGPNPHTCDLERLITPSLRRFFRQARLPEGTEGTRVRRLFLEAALTLAAALPRALDLLHPETVVTVNGSFFGEWLLLELCRKRGIPIYTYEPGFMKQTLQFRLDGAVTDGECVEAWRGLERRPLSSKNQAMIRAIIDERRAGGEATKIYYSPRDAEDRFQRVAGYRRGRPHVAMFTNVVWDVAVQFREIAFRDMYDWLDTTIEFFRDHPETALTIRVHPGEVKALAGRTEETVVSHIRGCFPELPDNVRLIPPEAQFNSYQLIEYSDAVLSYTSTIGLESALMGKPTIVSAKTHYRGKGFTLDPSTRREYLQLLARVATVDSPPPPDLEAAWRYAYAFFVLAQIPFPFSGKSEPGRFRGLDVPDLSYLAPGRHSGLDAICDAILQGREPVALEVV